MGVAIPGGGFVEDRASGALVVDGSLRFDDDKSHVLQRTSSAGSTTWTWSGWVKRSTFSTEDSLFSGYDGSTATQIYFKTDNTLRWYEGGADFSTTPVYRDPSGWYHFVCVRSGTSSLTIYVNGTQVAQTTSSIPSTSPVTTNNAAIKIGAIPVLPGGSNTYYFDGQLSQVYLIDGQALTPSSFGYTDPLTNTWRPKKLSSSVAFGTNGFYLPFDGSAPIGQDQSGRGNNWTPVNFGGSNTLEKATGALPILNTDGGGKVARVGVRTDSSASSLVLALPLVGIKSDFSNAVNGGTSNKAITANGNAAASSVQSNFYGGSFYLDGVGDYLETSTSNDFVVGTGDFTLEAWYNVDASQTTNARLFGQNTNNSSNWDCYIDGGTGTNAIYMHGGNTNLGMSFPSAGNWHHFCIVRSSGVLYSFMNGVLRNTQAYTNSVGVNNLGFRIGEIGPNGGSGYTLKGYVQDFRIYKGLAKYTQNFIPASTDPDILPDTPSGVSYTSNLTQITDGAVAFDGSGDYLELPYSSDLDFTGQFTLEAFVYPNASTGDYSVFGNFLANATGNWGLAFDYSTYGVFTSFYYNGNTQVENTGYVPIPRAWNHYAVTRDASNVIRVFLNGQLLPTTATYSGTLGVSAQSTFIGLRGGLNALNGTISNVHWVKGTCLYTSNFTPPTGPISSVANTKLLCCKSNSSATAFDVSPGTITANGNAAATNFNPFTANINAVRGKQSGWCTWNPISVYLQGGSTTSTLSNGNLNIAFLSGTNAANQYYSTIAVNNGRWYCEWTDNSSSPSSNSQAFILGVQNLEYPRNFLSETGGYGISNGSVRQLWLNGVNTNSWWSGTPTQGDVYGIALDCDNSTISFYRNGISLGSSQSIPANKTYAFAITPYQWQATSTGTANFGQKPFRFPPPAGFQPLALANTPRPTIVRPDQFVGVTTYSGNDGTQSINIGFKPDFVWSKGRNNTSNHLLMDTVRGGNKVLITDVTDSEYTGSYIQSFNTNGYTINSTSSGLNASGYTYVNWAWKAGGNSNTYNINDVGYATASAAGLTAGTITPTGASVNTKSGFSIITYTGTGSAATISHGGLANLSNGMIIVKNRSSATNWRVYHSAIGNTKAIFVSTTGGTDTSSVYWNNTSPTSTVFSVGSDDGINGNGNSIVAYCWAEIPGFSKFGSYTGNGSSDGPFVFTGFRPRWILIRSTSAARDWLLYDTARGVYNENVEGALQPNTSGTAYNSGYTPLDILSNGFKPRISTTNFNANGETHIYAAFAETPTQNLYGAQSNAR